MGRLLRALSFGLVAAGSGCASDSGDAGGLSSTAPSVQGPATPAQMVPAAVADALPCAVSSIVRDKCKTCHSAVPSGGAPMPLMTRADFVKDVVSRTTMPNVTKKVYELVKLRINDPVRPMPQGRMLEAYELSAFNAWLDAQAPAPAAGNACTVTGIQMSGSGKGNAGAGGATGMTTGGAGDVGQAGSAPVMMAGAGGAGGDTLPGQPGEKSRCDSEEAKAPLVPRDGETCYDFLVHGAEAPGDTSKFVVPEDETYNQFYYAIPWPAGTIATRFGADFDNLQVLHHWLAFTSTSLSPDGAIVRNAIGTTLGESAELLSGWAVGGCNIEFPEDMGLQLPASGKIMVQWHHYNFTGMPQQDGSKVQVCTLPAGSRPHLGGLTWLGTENIDVQAGQRGQAFGTCENDSEAPITIVAFWPHMHEIGVNMKSEVMRAGESTWTTVFDKPFDFNYQVHYTQDPVLVLQPGDLLRSTCSYMNTTTKTINFGQSTNDEMCYQFAFSYPAGALDNGVLSLIGATNTCWQFGE